MKKYLSIILLFIGLHSITKAQDCKEITRTINDMKGDTTYDSPLEKENLGLCLRQVINKYPPSPIIVIFKLTELDAHYNVNGVYIKFDDGTILSKSTAVDCTYLNSDIHYVYTAVMRLDAHNIETFKTKKVVKYQIDNVDVLVDDKFATKFRAWVNCMINIK